MNNFRLLIFFCLILIQVSLQGQTQFDNNEIPPAITGNNGKVFIGQQRGTILINNNSLLSGTPIDSITAGKELPAEMATTLLLTMPNVKTSPKLIVGLVSYKIPNAKDKYGVLRSVDFGLTWEIIKPAAFEDSLLNYKANYFQLPFKKFNWINDKVGFLYGLKGIFKTTDAGLNWVKVYTPKAIDEEVRAISFKDEKNGMALLGILYNNFFYKTIDGGFTWEFISDYPNNRTGLDLSYIENEYRCLTFYRAQVDFNAFVYYYDNSTEKWIEKKARNIEKGLTFMTEILWRGRKQGWLIGRAGEIWYTPDGGRTFELAQSPDTSKYKGLWGDDDKLPILGQSSMILDDSLIVQAASLRVTVNKKPVTSQLYYTARWPISSFNKQSSDVKEFENRLNKKYIIYPNPSSNGNFNLSIINLKKSCTKFSVFNLIGKEVYHKDLGEIIESSNEIDLSLLSKGNYIFVLNCGDEVSQKLITIY
jgi:hypothetical protein